MYTTTFSAYSPDIYRCQLRIKLSYREVKTQHEHVVKILLFAGPLALLLSRDLLDLVTEQTDDEFIFPTERWVASFRSLAQLILHVRIPVTHHRRCSND